METEQLRQATSIVRMLEKAASLGVWSIDLGSGAMHWSGHMAGLHGAAPGFEPQPGMEFDFYVPECREKVRRLVDDCAIQGASFDEEVQIVTLAGRRVWVRVLGQAIRDAHGVVTGVQGALQEIAPHGYAQGTLLRHTVSMGGAMGSGEAFATVDDEGQFSYLNEQALALLGAADGSVLLGRKIWSSFQKTVRLKMEREFRTAVARRQAVEFEELDARLALWLEVRCYPFGGGMAVHLRDVSARRQSQDQLRLLESCVGRLNDIVMITEAGPFNAPGPRIVFVNEAFERRTGYSPAEVIGKTPRILQGADTDRQGLDLIRASLEQWRPVRVDLVNYRKTGEPFWVDLDISPVWDRSRKLTHWVAVGRDISERKQSEEKIQYLAFYDALTRLPNRQLLLDRLELCLSGPDGSRKGALMFIDLDNFKVLNDTLGHQKGDILLQQVAQRLRACVSRGDTVARLGGDEFVVLLEDRADKRVDAAAARIVAQRIVETLGEPYVLPGYTHHSTCSIGVTLLGSADRNMNELLKQADLAMYQAKNAGRNTFCFFDPEMQTAATAGAALVTDLRQAWRAQQFMLVYQPQVGRAGAMTGVEALLRWMHPQRGLVGPSEFICAAEESSLILPLGRWVVETACAQLAQWACRPDRQHLSIAVNVSLRQFRHPEFVDEVMAAIRAAGIAPEKLKLELTETLFADGIEVSVAKMGNLKAMGVTLSLDDFGMGYSSLSYLKRLPLDQLKIDREFVKDILTDANDAAIARTIIGLAQSLGLEVIAEGVETPEQRQFLLEQGCASYQGFVFCKPLPIDELELFLDGLPAHLVGSDPQR